MKRILPTIVLAQFLCTSLWFAGNAVIPDIIRDFNLQASFLGHLISAVQFGFISGTLVFALLTISDRYSPSTVFFVCSVLAAVSNLMINFGNITSMDLLLSRFLTGFFLAGIYPVGMKIASDHYQKGLGKSLGFLVGALVLGTSFPHLIKSVSADLPWKFVVLATSALSVLGGIAMLVFVPNGLYRKQSQKMHLTAFANGFKDNKFRAASFGYFGHMWEVYTFWAFVPVMLAAYNKHNSAAELNVPLFSFLIIAFGGVACALGGLFSEKFGAKKIATIALSLSGMCCLLSPLFLFSSSSVLFIAFLFFWGLVVIADSPLFSTIVAQNAPEESKGTSITIVNCIGFSITIISIQLINLMSDTINPQYIYTVLAVGPVFGLIALYSKKEDKGG